MFVKTYCVNLVHLVLYLHTVLCAYLAMIINIHIYTYIHEEYLYIYIYSLYIPKTSLGSHAGVTYMYIHIYIYIYTHARFINPDQNEVLESTVKTHLVAIPWGLVLAALIDPT